MQVSINGLTCEVATAGPLADPATPALLLIHGAANDHAAWHDIRYALGAAGIRVFAPDLPGHGGSAGTALASVDALVDWIAALLDALDLPHAAIGGHSMGSLAALACAALYPTRITRLALLGSAVPMPVSPALLDAARDTPDAACRMIVDWSHTNGFAIGRNAGGGHGVWGPGKTLAVMRRNAATLVTDLANCNDFVTGLDAAAHVACPTLLLLGRRDRMTPARNAAPLQEALGARAICRDIDDCGHAMMVEQPRAIVEALKEFLLAK